MPRPISWLPRLPEIRRAVSGSVRSHYGRRELQQLFQLQSRAAQKLLDAMPTVSVGTSRLVEREALAALLERMASVDDPSAELAAARAAAQPASRRKLRSLLPHDHPPAHWDTLPPSLELAPGRVTLHFTRLEELALTMLDLVSLLDRHLEEFADRYELHPPKDDALQQEREEFRAMLRELEQLEAAHQVRLARERPSP